MSSAQIIHPPILPKPLISEKLTQMENRGEYNALGIYDCDFTGQTASEVLFEYVHFRRVIFTQTNLNKLRLVDTRAEVCDFSGATWEKPRLRRVEFIGCRLLGMQLLEAQLEDVLFRDCKLEDVLFASAMCKAVRFEKCMLRGAMLEESDLTGVVFQECDLTSISFLDSNLNEVDLRGSVLNGLQANPKDMRGAIIDPAQAIQVVSLFGVRVMELEN